ncbi:T9SS type A sorting domain-containing protein [bacterium]|nr:T9SS type A sorting domain-containing protein [bacterium]
MKEVNWFLIVLFVICCYSLLIAEEPTFTLTNLETYVEFIFSTYNIESSPRFVYVYCNFVTTLNPDDLVTDSLCTFAQVPRHCGIFDIDRDGAVDLCYIDPENGFHLLFSSGDYTDEFGYEVMPDKVITNLVIGDLNGDTYSDVILGVHDSLAPDTMMAQIWVDYGDEDGFDFVFENIRLVTWNLYPTEERTKINDIELGDLNRDGFTDIALAISGGSGSAYNVTALLNGIPNFIQHGVSGIAYSAIEISEFYPGFNQIGAAMSQFDILYFDSYGYFTRDYAVVDWGSFHFNNDVAAADVDENGTNDIVIGGVLQQVETVLNFDSFDAAYSCTLANIGQTVDEIVVLDDVASYILVRDISYNLYLLEKIDEGIDEVSLPPGFSMNVYPNPFNSTLKIEIVCVKTLHAASPQEIHESPLQAEIYDINGKAVGWLNGPNRRFGLDGCMENSGAQVQRITWTPEPAIPSGIYLIQVKTSNQSITKKVLYLK